MTNYWRNIIYLKKYTEHEMIEKVGSAKLEYRKSNLKGHIRITDEKSSTTWKAYIGHQAEGTLFLTFLDSLEKEGSDYILTFSKTEHTSADKILIIMNEDGDYCSEKSLENVKIQIVDITTDDPSIEKPTKKKTKEESVSIELTQAESTIKSYETSKQPDEWIDKILKNALGMYPFEDNEFHQCVKLEPKDFGLLPSKNWVLGSNSFLLNGYYSYRHILFGVKEHNGKKVGYLGVPGTYHRREIFIANMFGFSLFKGIQEKKNTTIGDFGYWIMEVD